jgi:hypothetical protein
MTLAQTPGPALLAMIGGFRVTQAIYVAARLELADRLKDGPREVEELAKATGTHARSLERLMSALAGVGLFAKEGRQFALTPMGQLLRRDHPRSLRGQAVAMGEPWAWRVTGELEHSVRTGEPAHARVMGVDIWRYFAEHPEAQAVFDEAMNSLSAQEIEPILTAFDFSTARKVVDLGGGQGALLAAILRANPGIAGVLFEREEVVGGARALLEREGVEARCEVVAGDLFRAVAPGGDLYLLKRVLHDWTDEQAIAILRACVAAMASGARLLVIEPMIPRGSGPHPARWLDLQMLVSQGGRERTDEELRALLGSVGLEVTRIIPAGLLLSIVEAKRN